MKPTSALCASLLMVAFSMQSLAQNTDWLPVPYGQTSYFQDSATMEVIPMATDWWAPGSPADTFGIYRQALEDEWGDCAFALWHPSYPCGPPTGDFQHFTASGSEIAVQGFTAGFSIPIAIQPGQWASFGAGFVVRYDQISPGTVLGTADSIRYYSVFTDDSTSLAGSFALSKHHGLIWFTPFRVYESYPDDAGQEWHLIGYKNVSNEAGFSMPAKLDYMPYTPGDDIVFKYTYYATSPFIETVEYHHLQVTAVDTSAASPGISGICAQYNAQGFYLSTDSNYAIPFEQLFQEMTERPFSIPYVATVLSYPHWYQAGTGVRAEFGGYEAVCCDTISIVDGQTYSYRFSTEYGMLRRYKTPSSIVPVIHELYAAEAQQFTYGTWPQWLGANDISPAISTRIYPNPATDKVYIDAAGRSLMVEILSLDGRIAASGTYDSPSALDVSHLAAGCYIIRIDDGSGLESQPLVIQKI